MGNWRKSLEKWWYGDPPLDQKVIDTIDSELSVLLTISGIFLDPRPTLCVISSLILLCNFTTLSSYMFLLGATAIRQTDDFVTASQTVHLAALDFVAVSCMCFTTIRRKTLMHVLRTMSNGYFDYGDGFVIPEMEDEYRTTKKQKIIILIVLPVYLFVAAVCFMLGRTIDSYFGRASNETYENGIYMLTPVPIWYPIIVHNDVTHWILVLSQSIAALALTASISGTIAVYVLTCQSISLQFKILIYRMRKIKTCAYRLHRQNGGKKLAKEELFSDTHFLKCINICMNKHAEHHAVLIQQHHHVQHLLKWQSGVALLTASVLIAMSLLAFVAGGGKPSILALASFAIVAEVLSIATVCGLSESVQELGESIHEELYNMDWMDMDPSAKKSMMIMIQRSKKSLVIMAGGLQPLNWESFSAIINTAYSYVNLLVAADV